jgi:hypothetical protein
MAKLSKCRTCSQTVSTRAKHCPNCGEGKPGSRKVGYKGALLLLLISAAFAGGLTGGQRVEKMGKHLTAWADRTVADYNANVAARIEPAAGD